MKRIGKSSYVISRGMQHAMEIRRMAQKSIFPQSLSFMGSIMLGMQMSSLGYVQKSYERGEAKKEERDKEVENTQAVLEKYLRMKWEDFYLTYRYNLGKA